LFRQRHLIYLSYLLFQVIVLLL